MLYSAYDLTNAHRFYRSAFQPSHLSAARMRAFREAVQAEQERRAFLAGVYRRAVTASGLRLAAAPPLLITTNVANAASDGVHVLVNPEWAKEQIACHCIDDVCDYVVLFGVFAHELGHHVERHAIQLARASGRLPWWQHHRMELRADWRAGRALFNAGVEPDDFQRVMAFLSWQASHTHPHGAERTLMIEDGWCGLPFDPPV